MGKETKARILFFVEDEPDIVELYTIAFESNGFSVQSIDNGGEAIDQLKKFTKEDVSKPNVMILDILLPDASGMDILREARKNLLFDNTPIIMFTNFSSDEIRAEIERMKNTRYLLKMEVTPDQLVETIKEMLNFA
ncbi:MAG: response regulator [bacterium]